MVLFGPFQVALRDSEILEMRIAITLVVFQNSWCVGQVLRMAYSSSALVRPSARSVQAGRNHLLVYIRFALSIMN